MAALLLELVCTHINDPSELERYLAQLSSLLVACQVTEETAQDQIQAATRWDIGADPDNRICSVDEHDETFDMP